LGELTESLNPAIVSTRSFPSTFLNSAGQFAHPESGGSQLRQFVCLLLARKLVSFSFRFLCANDVSR